MSDQNKKKFNPTIAVLAVLAVVAVGALAYVSSHLADKQTQKAGTETQQMAQGEGAEDTGVEIVPGNPVVAQISGQDITRAEVGAYIRTLPAQVQQMPVDTLFPAALDQMINERLVRQQAEKVNLDSNAEVKEKLAEAKKEIVATVFLKKAIADQITPERIQKAYDAFKQDFPEVEEVKAEHILVDDEATANKLIQKLEDGADFAALATEYSKDTASAQNGGNIGYFAKTDVVPEFGEAAFSQEIGKHSFKPVKSEFGYHIIKVEERRMRPVPTLEQIKPQLEAQIRQAAMQDLFKQWRADADISVFDINGQPIEPAAGDANSEADSDADEAAE